MKPVFKIAKLYFLLIFFTVCCFTNLVYAQKAVKLYGKLLNFNNEIEVRDNSELSDLTLNPSDRMVIPDSLGNFKIEFEIKSPNYFMIGRNLLFLSPGDSIEMNIDYLYPKKSQFKGTHANENNYLRDVPLPKMASFLEGGSNIKTTIKQTIDTIKFLQKKQRSRLENINGADESFKKLEGLRIRADYFNSLENIARYYLYMNHMPIDSFKAVVARCGMLTNPLLDSLSANFTDKDYLKLAVYRDNIKLIKNRTHTKSDDVNDFLTAKEIFYKISKSTDKSKIAIYKDSIMLIKNADYKNELLKSYKALMSFGNGDEVIDFIAKNEKGEKVSLQNYKGNLIILDFWATWCGPCMEELLYLEKLKEKYKGKEVVFISISIDEDESKWLNDLAKRKATGIQWNISRDKIRDYAVNGIPRTIIIDKNFKINQMKAPLPSSPKMDSLIDSLLLK